MQKSNDTDRQRFASVWDAIEDTPQQAASMRARSDLMRGKINLFSLDTLIDMAATAGMSPSAKVSKPKVVHQKRIKRVAAPELVAA